MRVRAGVIWPSGDGGPLREKMPDMGGYSNGSNLSAAWVGRPNYLAGDAPHREEPNASPLSCRDALRSINAAHSLAAGYGAVERNRTPHSIALSRRGERPVFVWGIVSRFAEPSQRWGLFFPLATFVVSGEFASSRQAPLRALLGGTRVLGAALWPSIGAHRQRHVFRAVFCRAIVVGRRHS